MSRICIGWFRFGEVYDPDFLALEPRCKPLDVRFHLGEIALATFLRLGESFDARLYELDAGQERSLVVVQTFQLPGVEPSGGEQQKIVMARALHKGGSIVILDEPTAALDPIAEAEIYEQFNDMV